MEINKEEEKDKKLTNDEIIKFLHERGFNMDDELEKDHKPVLLSDFNKMGWDTPY